jgi:hypothetical protein
MEDIFCYQPVAGNIVIKKKIISNSLIVEEKY